MEMLLFGIMYFGLIQMNFSLIVNIILIDSLIICCAPEIIKDDLLSYMKMTFPYVKALNWVDLLWFIMKKKSRIRTHYVKMVKMKNI